jgi:hypothetical protein
MKTTSPGHCALGACAAVAILAGCSGAAQFPNPAAQTALGNARIVERSGSSKLERLRTPGDRVKGGCESDGIISGGCDFHARGRAVGPYPGTFVVHCQSSWFKFSLKEWWTFQEHFIIRSGGSKISGTIEANGSGGESIPLPGVYQYTTKNGYSGNVTIKSLAQFFGPDADFRETFDGM